MSMRENGFGDIDWSQPFLWTPSSPNGTSGTVTLITGSVTGPTLLAGINNYGQIAGTQNARPEALPQYGSAFLWTPSAPNGTAGTVSTDSRFTGVVGINDFGQAIMNGQPPMLFTPAVAHASSGTFTALTGLGSSPQLIAINAGGTILGVNSGHGFLWTPAAPNGASGSATGIPPMAGFVSMTPAALNARGDVTGIVRRADGVAAPFLYSGGTSYDLSALSAELRQTTPAGMNDRGQIILNEIGAVFLLTPGTSQPPSPVTAGPASGSGSTVTLAGSRRGEHPDRQFARRAKRLLPGLQPTLEATLPGGRFGRWTIAATDSGRRGHREQQPMHRECRGVDGGRRRRCTGSDHCTDFQRELCRQPGGLPGGARPGRRQLRLAAAGDLECPGPPGFRAVGQPDDSGRKQQFLSDLHVHIRRYQRLPRYRGHGHSDQQRPGWAAGLLHGLRATNPGVASGGRCGRCGRSIPGICGGGLARREQQPMHSERRGKLRGFVWKCGYLETRDCVYRELRGEPGVLCGHPQQQRHFGMADRGVGRGAVGGVCRRPAMVQGALRLSSRRLRLRRLRIGQVSAGLPAGSLVPPRRLRLRRRSARQSLRPDLPALFDDAEPRIDVGDLAGQDLDIGADLADVFADHLHVGPHFFADAGNLYETDRQAGQHSDDRKANREVKLKVGDHFVSPVRAGGLLHFQDTAIRLGHCFINSSAPRQGTPAIHIPGPQAGFVVSPRGLYARRYAQIQTGNGNPWPPALWPCSHWPPPSRACYRA
ncbi:hypothetical protein SBA4_5340002 [Candidatus Sulfopaludibacter sp. SbA4]|nr:hypothetical protein SBA4_5340002 [Candidatus Sulfopaludibacter sp. SbA4]